MCTVNFRLWSLTLPVAVDTELLWRCRALETSPRPRPSLMKGLKRRTPFSWRSIRRLTLRLISLTMRATRQLMSGIEHCHKHLEILRKSWQMQCASHAKLYCREVGTIIRSLNCYPSEAELHDMIQEVEEEEPTGFIRLEKFQPMMARVLMERRYNIPVHYVATLHVILLYLLFTPAHVLSPGTSQLKKRCSWRHSKF